MVARIVCLLVGYVCGCFLTADVVCKIRTGHWAREVGTHNPGMANIASYLGLDAAVLTLAGDIAKTVLACELCQRLFFPDMGELACLWAGCGVTIGHNLPFWTGFRGGKGVTCTCAALVLALPLWGIVACVVGLVVVLITKYLCYGAVVIPAVFCIPAFIVLGIEAFALSVFLTVMMLQRHWSALCRARAGTQPQVDILSKLH